MQCILVTRHAQQGNSGRGIKPEYFEKFPKNNEKSLKTPFSSFLILFYENKTCIRIFQF